mmetsp:Transcript_2073/g.2498  ORF Transcript_2073/g.2498 Transcript_2073/m.2498 type:complete len:94 (-) Transcript_2073:751-1032(-)
MTRLATQKYRYTIKIPKNRILRHTHTHTKSWRLWLSCFIQHIKEVQTGHHTNLGRVCAVILSGNTNDTVIGSSTTVLASSSSSVTSGVGKSVR